MEATDNPQSLAFVEGLYTEFLRDPQAVSPQWREYFAQWDGIGGFAAARGPSFQPQSIFARPAGAAAPAAEPSILPYRVYQLIRNFRVRGHIAANIDPLGLPRPQPTELDLKYYHFTEADLDRPMSLYEDQPTT